MTKATPRPAGDALPRRAACSSGRRRPSRRVSGVCPLSLLVLLVSWNPATTNCRGGPLRSPIVRYELKIFEMRAIGMSGTNPIYLRSLSRTTTATSTDVDPPVGGVVGWDNMWSATWTIQNPPVVAVSLAGHRSDTPCP